MTNKKRALPLKHRCPLCGDHQENKGGHQKCKELNKNK